MNLNKNNYSQKKIIVANYHKPYPPRDGADNRCIDMIKAFQALGYKVILFSSDLYVQSPWTKEAVKETESELKVKVIIYLSTEGEKNDFLNSQHNWKQFTTPGLINFFNVVYNFYTPGIVLINYAFWAKLAIGAKFKKSICIIDAIDLLSLNQKMAHETLEYLNRGAITEGFQYMVENANEDVIKENFFEERNFSTDKEEFEVYDEFDITFAINSKEQEIISANTFRTKSVYLPFTFDVTKNTKTYSSAPIFAIGPNQFNYQGYLYFVKKVLPMILLKEPAFNLEVLGDGCKALQVTNGVHMLGFVDDLKDKYAKSKFAICPLIGATGQQLKVMEAMANGLPVVALRNVAERCPIIHNINGFIADDAAEFASFTLELYKNQVLCSKMGQAARQTIEDGFSKVKLIQSLEKLVEEHIKERPGNVINVNIKKLYWYQVLLYKSKGKLIGRKIKSFQVRLLNKVKVKKN